MRLTWAEFKSLVDTHKLNVMSLVSPKMYELSAFMGQKEISCILPRLDAGYAASLAEFESGYLPYVNRPSPIISSALSDPGGFTFAGRKIVSQVMPAGQTTVCDYVMPETLWLTALMGKGYNCGTFDACDFSIVIPVGHALNATESEIIALETATNWGVSDDLQQVELYKSQVPSGFILRVTYHSTGATDSSYWINAFLHRLA